MSDARLDEVEMLRGENARLRERVATLERDLGSEVAFPVAWRLTHIEERFLSAMLKRSTLTRAQAMDAVYWDYDEEPDASTLDSHFSKIRKKLRAFGIDLPPKQRFAAYRLGDELRRDILTQASGGRP